MIKKHSVREAEQEAGLHTDNVEGKLTPEQTSEQQQQGNPTFDSQKEGAQVLPGDNSQAQAQGQKGAEEQSPVTAEDQKGTITDPVSFSNPAYDPSVDAAKVNLKGKDLEKSSDDLLHVFKPGHYYRKGDEVRYHGVYFRALQDMHGDIAPSMWEPTGKVDSETDKAPQDVASNDSSAKDSKASDSSSKNEEDVGKSA